jgi:hypothetical protein
MIYIRMIMNDKREEALETYFKVLSWQLFEMTEVHNIILSQDCRFQVGIQIRYLLSASRRSVDKYLLFP